MGRRCPQSRMQQPSPFSAIDLNQGTCIWVLPDAYDKGWSGCSQFKKSIQILYNMTLVAMEKTSQNQC